MEKEEENINDQIIENIDDLMVLKNEIDKLGSAIITSHSNSLIERLCDLVILIHEGEIIDIDESSQVLRKYKKDILHINPLLCWSKLYGDSDIR